MNTTAATKTLTNFDLVDAATAYLKDEAQDNARLAICSINSRPTPIDRAETGWTLWSVGAVIHRRVSGYHRHLALVASPAGKVTVFDFVTDHARDTFIRDWS